MRILLVEPDEYYHAQFQRILSDLAELQIARSAEMALAMLAANPPDLLILELLLPDRPGYEVLDELRKRVNPSLPVIIFSRIGQIEDIGAALDYGVTSFFVKGQDTINDIRKLLLTYKYDLQEPRSRTR